MSKYTSYGMLLLVFALLVSACATSPANLPAATTEAVAVTTVPVTVAPLETTAPLETAVPAVTTEAVQPSPTADQPATTAAAGTEAPSIVVTPATPAVTPALPSTGAGCPMTDDEYAVYSAVIQEKFLKAQDVSLIVVRDTTVGLVAGDIPPVQEDFLRSQKPDQADDLLADLNMKMAQPCPFEARFDEQIPVRFISEAEQGRFFQQNLEQGWKDFYTQNPGAQGIMEFSRVGFSEDGTVAAVYVGNQQGGLAGGGYNYLLEKRSGQWTVVAETMTWIS